MKSWHDQAVEVGCQLLDLYGTREMGKADILGRRNARIVKALGQEGGIPALLAAVEEITRRRPQHRSLLTRQIEEMVCNQEEVEVLDRFEALIAEGWLAQDALAAIARDKPEAVARVKVRVGLK